MAELSQLLLFDTSSRHLDTLSFGFEKAGCTVVGTSEMETAQTLLRASRPSVVVVGVHTGDAQGFDLIRSLGHAAETRDLPCVAFGRPELRNDSVAAGAFGFLSIPIFVSDIIGACRLIAATSTAKDSSPAEAEVVMKLEEIESIYHLIRIFSVIGRSAVVQAAQGAKRGELRFIDGVLTAIRLGALQGLPALHQLLLWNKAELRLKFKSVGRQGNQLSLKPSEVLEECDRFLRDFAHEVAGLGSSRTIFEPNPSRRPAANMPSEVVPVLKQFDGRRELAQIVEDSPFRVFDTLRIIKRFVADEAIVAREPRAALAVTVASRVSGPAALDEWFQRSPAGRELDAAVLQGSDSLPQNLSQVTGGEKSTDEPPPASAVSRGDRGGGDAPAPDKRLVGEREHVTTLRLVPSGEPSQGEALEAPAAPSSAGEDATSMSMVDTPPPIVAPIASRPVGAVAGVAAAPRTFENVKHGEIRVAPTTVRKTGSIPAAGDPSVFVDLAPLSATPRASTSPIPDGEPRPAPVAPLVTPVVAATVIPVAATRAAPAAMAVGAPMPTAPPTPAPAAAFPAAHLAAPSRGHGASASATPGRPPPRPFDDVESDFFDREADLYRRDSVETFDDLDGTHTRGPESRNPPGKR
jgi:ActR/RegA family two-component response regulator